MNSLKWEALSVLKRDIHPSKNFKTDVWSTGRILLASSWSFSAQRNANGTSICFPGWVWKHIHFNNASWRSLGTRATLFQINALLNCETHWLVRIFQNTRDNSLAGDGVEFELLIGTLCNTVLGVSLVVLDAPSVLYRDLLLFHVEGLSVLRHDDGVGKVGIYKWSLCHIVRWLRLD